MSLKERVDAFSAAARDAFGLKGKSDLRSNFGVSNGAKIVEGGLQLGVSNLEKFSGTTGQFAMGCMIRFPPEDEIYFAIQVKSDLPAFMARLAQMAALGATQKGGKGDEGDEPDTDEAIDEPAPGSMAYSHRNNLAVIYLASDGKLYLRNKRFWESLNFDLSTVGPGIEIDRILVSVWPPAASARRSVLARQLIGYLGSLAGREKVHEIKVWSDAGAVSADMQRMPETIPVAQIEAAVAAQGGHYPGGEVSRLHGALNFLSHKHFVILAGLSGSGKTQLALKYARAVHGLADSEASDPFLFVCPVRPEWTDPTGLTGYHDVLTDKFMVPRFLEAVLTATTHRDTPVFVVLDELNLARVEYYFSDVLSAIETQEPIQLHSAPVALEGSNGISVPDSLTIPPNLYIIGTINVDETTNPVSDKVLDRAVVIDMSNIDLPGFLVGLEKREPGLAAARAACEQHLTAAHAIMQQHGVGFGYRVAGEVVRYHAFAAAKLGAGASSVTDDLMVQKILVKLRGSARQGPMLSALAKALDGLPQSQALLTRLADDLEEYGSFQATR